MADSSPKEFELKGMHQWGKTYNIAKFDKKIDVSKFVEPVTICQKEKAPLQAMKPFDPMSKDWKDSLPTKGWEERHKQRKLSQQPWHLEDSRSSRFIGTREVGQNAPYVLLYMKGENELSAIPVTDWYHFRPNIDGKQKKSLEEAEAALSKRIGPVKTEGEEEEGQAKIGRFDSDEDGDNEENAEGLDFENKASDDEGDEGGWGSADEDAQNMVKAMNEQRSESEEDALETAAATEAAQNPVVADPDAEQEEEEKVEEVVPQAEESKKRPLEPSEDNGESSEPAKKKIKQEPRAEDSERTQKKAWENQVKKILTKKGEITAGKLMQYFTEKKFPELSNEKKKKDLYQLIGRLTNMKEMRDGTKLLYLKHSDS